MVFQNDIIFNKLHLSNLLASWIIPIFVVNISSTIYDSKQRKRYLNKF